MQLCHDIVQQSGLSDVRSAQHGPPWASFCVAIGDIRCKLRELRVELSSLKRSEQLNQEAMRDSFTESMNTLKVCFALFY